MGKRKGGGCIMAVGVDGPEMKYRMTKQATSFFCECKRTLTLHTLSQF